MKQTLHYTDEKSDKFWQIETGGCALVVNWGRTGTAEQFKNTGSPDLSRTSRRTGDPADRPGDSGGSAGPDQDHGKPGAGA